MSICWSVTVCRLNLWIYNKQHFLDWHFMLFCLLFSNTVTGIHSALRPVIVLTECSCLYHGWGHFTLIALSQHVGFLKSHFFPPFRGGLKSTNSETLNIMLLSLLLLNLLFECSLCFRKFSCLFFFTYCSRNDFLFFSCEILLGHCMCLVCVNSHLIIQLFHLIWQTKNRTESSF